MLFSPIELALFLREYRGGEVIKLGEGKTELVRGVLQGCKIIGGQPESSLCHIKVLLASGREEALVIELRRVVIFDDEDPERPKLVEERNGGYLTCVFNKPLHGRMPV